VKFTTGPSVIAARGLDGSVAAFGSGRKRCIWAAILSTPKVPRRGPDPRIAKTLSLLAAKLLNAFDYVGVLAV